MKQKLVKIMTTSIIIISLLSLIIVLYTQQSMFGALPKGERLERIKASPHFKNGVFENIHHTPTMSEDVGIWDNIKHYFLAKNKRPNTTIPSKKNDLLHLSKDENILVWFGHSSYFMQIDGTRILVDPVMSGSASPLPFTVKAFDGTDVYTPDDLPEIDYLFITHDHWDHLDYQTIRQLRGKIKHVITGLGTGAHFERWGFEAERIIEKEWDEHLILENGFEVIVTPSRHFSGRGFRPNRAMWASFVLQTPDIKLFIGGDSGYDTHFKSIGEKYGPFDLVILENGQYNQGWKYIHMTPAQTLQAAEDLNAQRLFPVHSSKFALANHAWDTPLKTLIIENKKHNIPLVTPIIGERVYLKDTKQVFARWWEKVQ